MKFFQILCVFKLLAQQLLNYIVVPLFMFGGAKVFNEVYEKSNIALLCLPVYVCGIIAMNHIFK